MDIVNNQEILDKVAQQYSDLKLENAKMVDRMHEKYNQPYDFSTAVDIVLEYGNNDLLAGMEKIKDIRIDDIYDEDDARKRRFLVSAYRVVFSEMSKLF
tara:strand:+ start:774 stop:1070 length:297 start_codon:yes stop_codon:yes gene_type:complete